MNTKIKYCLATVFIIIIVVVAILVLHKEDPTFSEYIENNIIQDDFRIEDDFSIYAEEDGDNLELVKKYFEGLGVKGSIFENMYVEVEDGGYSNVVGDNLEYGDYYYIINDTDSGREFEAVVVDGNVLFEELVY